jgi:hypothetical protein
MPVLEQRLAAVNLQEVNLTSERPPDGHQVASHQVATSKFNGCVQSVSDRLIFRTADYQSSCTARIRFSFRHCQILILLFVCKRSRL